MPQDVIAIVLAGGRSRRMGATAPLGGKAAIPFGDQTMLERVCRIVVGEAGRVIVVAAAGQPLPTLPAGVEVICDSVADRGPLAAIRDGVAYALANGPRPKVAVLVSCDVPDLAPGVVRLLIEKARACDRAWVVPVVGGHLQVLLSAMTASALAMLGSEATAHLKSPLELLDAIRAKNSTSVLLLNEPELRDIDPMLASFADIDTPEELAKARASIT